MNKRYIRKFRKAKLQELKHLLSEASSFSYLQENKNLPSTKKKARYLISEFNRLVGAYSALLMLEFYEKGTLETIGVLKNLKMKNALNHIGIYLMNIVDELHDTVEAMDVLTSKESSYKTSQKPMSAGGAYNSPKPSMPKAGYHSGFSEEAIHEGLFDFFKKKTPEPYVPKPSSLMDPTSGKIVGTFEPSKRTGLGISADFTTQRQELIDKYTKEMGKIIPFITAYLEVFSEKNQDKLRSTKKGLFGSSPAASLIKREFGKVPGFNVEQFLKQIEKNPNIVEKNLQFVADPNRYVALTSLEDIFQKVKSKIKKGLGSTVVSFLGGAQHYQPSRG